MADYREYGAIVASVIISITLEIFFYLFGSGIQSVPILTFFGMFMGVMFTSIFLNYAVYEEAIAGVVFALLLLLYAITVLSSTFILVFMLTLVVGVIVINRVISWEIR